MCLVLGPWPTDHPLYKDKSRVEPMNSAGVMDNQAISSNVCYTCKIGNNSRTEKWIGCDICNLWFHIQCVDISQANFKVLKSISSLKWFCTDCCGTYKNNKDSPGVVLLTHRVEELMLKMVNLASHVEEISLKLDSLTRSGQMVQDHLMYDSVGVNKEGTLLEVDQTRGPDVDGPSKNVENSGQLIVKELGLCSTKIKLDERRYDGQSSEDSVNVSTGNKEFSSQTDDTQGRIKHFEKIFEARGSNGMLTGQKSEIKKQEVFVVGDSIVRGAASYLTAKGCQTRVFGGIRIDEVGNMIEGDIQNPPKVLALHVGTNNIKDKTNVHVMQRLATLLDTFKERTPHQMHYIVNGIVYRNDVADKKIDNINESIEWMCTKYERVHFLDPNRRISEWESAKDGIHLNYRGGLFLGQLMEEKILEVLSVAKNEASLESLTITSEN